MVLNLSNETQVKQRPHVVVGAEENQTNCWQKATLKVSLFSCFEKFRNIQYKFQLYFKNFDFYEYVKFGAISLRIDIL